MNATITKLCRKHLGLEPLVVGPGIRTAHADPLRQAAGGRRRPHRQRHRRLRAHARHHHRRRLRHADRARLHLQARRVRRRRHRAGPRHLQPGAVRARRQALRGRAGGAEDGGRAQHRARHAVRRRARPRRAGRRPGRAHPAREQGQGARHRHRRLGRAGRRRVEHHRGGRRVLDAGWAADHLRDGTQESSDRAGRWSWIDRR